MVPIAITIAAPSVPPARVTIIFDHQLDAWQFDDFISIANRTFWLGHEVGHAIEHGKMKDLPLEALAWSYGAFFLAVASVVRDEYSANFFGSALCKLAFADQQLDGNALLVSSLGVGHIDSISALCAHLCSFSVEVAAQRCRPQSTPSDLRKLQDTAFSLLQELAIVLTHAVSLHAPSNQDDILRAKLSKIEGFTKYVAASWPDFTAGIADYDRDRSQNLLLRFFDGVLSRLGLRFEDTPQGIYLHFVRVPTLADLLAAGITRLSGAVTPKR